VRFRAPLPCIVFSRKGSSLRAINRNSSSCCVFTKGTSSVLSITTHHRCVFSRKGRPSVLSSQLIIVFAFHEGRPPCYQSHLIIRLCLKGASPCYQSHNSSMCYVFFHERYVPPCYQSQLFIMLCFHERASLRAINRNHHRNSVFHEGHLRAINHASSCCVFTKGASSVLSILLIVMLCFHERARPSVLSITTHRHVVFSRKGILRAINHICHHVVFSRGHVPPALSITTLIVMLCFHEGASLRAINHNSSSCCVFTKGTSSVLSITSHRSLFSRKGRPSVLSITTVIMLCVFTKGRLRAIIRISSSCCVFTKEPSSCYQSQLFIVVFSRRARPLR
jgi:hypothetical protein